MYYDADSVFNEVGDDATIVAAGVVETRVERKHSTEDGVFVRTGHQKLVLLLVVFLEEEGRRGEDFKWRLYVVSYKITLYYFVIQHWPCPTARD